MIRILGLDFETQCEQARTTRITEMGAITYNVHGDGTWVKRTTFSRMCWEPDYPAQTKEIVELTGITDDMLVNQGVARADVLAELLPLVREADVIVAHKVAFDRTVLLATADLLGIEMPKKEWLCTLTNFPWPKRITCKKLSHIAYEHGIMVHPSTLHRAYEDVDLMFRVLQQYDLNEVLSYSRTPWVYLRAHPIEPWKDGEVQTNMAKKLGFGWQRVKYDEEREFKKMWVTRVKENEYAEFSKITDALPFRVDKIEGIN